MRNGSLLKLAFLKSISMGLLIKKTRKTGGIGVVIGNSEGQFMGACWIHKLLTIEAIAAVKALDFARSMGFFDIVSEVMRLG